MNKENLNIERERAEAERLIELMTKNEPALVEGVDFMACNFGDESQNYSEAGRDSIVSGSSGSAVYDRGAGHWRLADPYMKIVNVSHLPEIKKIKMNIKFEDFRKLLE